jgi:hypothetical protein
MRKLLLIALLAAACSRDTVETRNPGGDPVRPIEESTTSTATTTTVGTTTDTATTAATTTSSGTQQP